MKIFHWRNPNRDLNGKFVRAYSGIKSFLKKVLVILLVIGAGYSLVQAGRFIWPTTVYAVQEKQIIVEAEAPVLDRIAKCESGNTHFGKSGQVLMRGNTNGSVDIGIMQINVSIWGAKATELGYNLAIEKDNKEFARWLYKNYGTEPWVWSKKCWSK